MYSQELVTPTLELNSGSQSCSSRVAMDYSSEIKYLRNKLKANETEKEKFIAKLAELQVFFRKSYYVTFKVVNVFKQLQKNINVDYLKRWML